MAKSLNYIIEVAELGNLNKAAAALEITSSALSKYIISKEKELGVDLFERVGKKFVLTYAGQRYVQWAKKISQMQNKMDEELKSIAACRSGIIYFGFQLMMSKVVIADIILSLKHNIRGLILYLRLTRRLRSSKCWKKISSILRSQQ